MSRQAFVANLDFPWGGVQLFEDGEREAFVWGAGQVVEDQAAAPGGANPHNPFGHPLMGPFGGPV